MHQARTIEQAMNTLKALAAGTPKAHVTEQAKAALRRLAERGR